jgi:hypothetical protein
VLSGRLVGRCRTRCQPPNTMPLSPGASLKRPGGVKPPSLALHLSQRNAVNEVSTSFTSQSFVLVHWIFAHMFVTRSCAAHWETRSSRPRSCAARLRTRRRAGVSRRKDVSAFSASLKISAEVAIVQASQTSWTH